MIEVIGLLVGCGFFPCLLFGVIMLISFLTCDYIEKFVVKTFCSFKNRRRRFRDKGSLQLHAQSSKKYGKHDKPVSSGSIGTGTASGQKQHTQLSTCNLPHSSNFQSPSASTSTNVPATMRLPGSQRQAQQSQDPNTSPRVPVFDDPPPAYHECVSRTIPQNPNPNYPKDKKD